MSSVHQNWPLYSDIVRYEQCSPELAFVLRHCPIWAVFTRIGLCTPTLSECDWLFPYVSLGYFGLCVFLARVRFPSIHNSTNWQLFHELKVQMYTCILNSILTILMELYIIYNNFKLFIYHVTRTYQRMPMYSYCMCFKSCIWCSQRIEIKKYAIRQHGKGGGLTYIFNL